MSQLSNSANAVNTNSAISLNPNTGTAILIGGGHQNLQAHPQISQLNSTTMIQLPSSMNPMSSTGNTSNILNTSTNPNNTTTFILNPSTNAVQNLQPQPQAHQTTAQIINTSQINQMIAASPLIAAPQQTPQSMPQQFQLQTHQPQAQIKLEDPQISNGMRLPNLIASNGFSSNQQSPMAKINGTLEHAKNDTSTPSSITNGPIEHQTKNIKNIHPIVVLDKQRLQELVQEVDPNEQLEEEVEDVLLSIADDFIDSLVSTSCIIARHRKSTSLDVKDVQMALEKNWNMWIPGFGVDGVVGVLSGTSGTGQGSAASAAALAKPKKCISTEAHKQRMALIKKTLKKF